MRGLYFSGGSEISQMKSVIVVEHDPVEVELDENVPSVEEEVEEDLSAVLTEGSKFGPLRVQDINVSLGITRAGWEPGEPCPGCSNTEISVMEQNEGIYRSKNGEFQFQSLGDNQGPPLTYLCPECMIRLYSHSTIE